MSSDLYKTRLFFYKESHKGLAKSDEVEVFLDCVPEIDGLPKGLTEIDFAPTAHSYELRVGSESKREMHPPEIEIVRRWLHDIRDYVRSKTRRD